MKSTLALALVAATILSHSSPASAPEVVKLVVAKSQPIKLLFE